MAMRIRKKFTLAVLLFMVCIGQYIKDASAALPTPKEQLARMTIAANRLPRQKIKNPKGCNSNPDCQAAFYCVGGTANSGSEADKSEVTGVCMPAGPLRFICWIQAILTRPLAIGMLILAIASSAITMILKAEIISIASALTLAIAGVLTIAPDSFVSMVTKSYSLKILCNF